MFLLVPFVFLHCLIIVDIKVLQLKALEQQQQQQQLKASSDSCSDCCSDCGGSFGCLVPCQKSAEHISAAPEGGWVQC